MSEEARLVVVGGGLAGVSLAYALAERGRGEGVVLLEREPGLGRHSSGRNAAILRTAIASPVACAMSLETARFLRTPPPGFHASPLLDETGLLLFEGAEATDAEPAWLAAHLAEKEPVERLRLEDCARLAPGFTPTAARAWWFPRQGRVDASALLDGFAAGARRGGVELRTGARVARLVDDEDGAVAAVELTDGTRIRTRTVVVAAGAWAGRLAPDAGRGEVLRPTRRHLLVTAPDAAVDAQGPVLWDDVAAFYARPESGGLLVSACDQTAVDPERCDEDPAVRELVAAKVQRHLPSFADAGAAHFWAGLRTLTPDDAPCIGSDPRRPGLFWLAGLGGHGVSLSVAAGRDAAALLAGEAPPRAEGLAPERFARALSRAQSSTQSGTLARA